MQCNHQWNGKGPGTPVHCPRCQSKNWDGSEVKKKEITTLILCSKCGEEKREDLAFCPYCKGYHTEKSHVWGLPNKQFENLKQYAEKVNPSTPAIAKLREALELLKGQGQEVRVESQAQEQLEVEEEPKIKEQEPAPEPEVKAQEVLPAVKESPLLEEEPYTPPDNSEELEKEEALKVLDEIEWD